MTNPRCPTVDQCHQMMTAMEMPAHIVAHSTQVSRVALWLCDAINALAPCLDRGLVQAASLLHDITKARSFSTGENHAASGEIYLARQGFRRVGRIVAQHVKLDVFDPAGSPTEAEVVNYADKRVLHDRIVPLDRRMAYILERYGAADPVRQQRILDLWEETRRLEIKLFRELACGPEAVEQLG
ncbi:MAG TPA: HDIG domain-containing protein [Desulfobacteraceae bacterium]|nr:HDIG domain-containing protein [Deltaproteobacteria bacterium]MBW2355606.1 HDIG domain-containing protein [Deltaproteobacteria bacterium]RLB98334.1 MAG: metal-dependent phosphohydrolase [Deltaproteobacteria bacterium]HDI59012.1 HDIG domain-containing protein [Desulfobacteraceae bacterium]